MTPATQAPPQRYPLDPAAIPLSLYVHVPWCEKKCPYCDFNSHQRTTELPIAEYLDTLEQELYFYQPELSARKLQTIFFGGGTPSLLNGDAIATILNRAQEIVGFHDDIEITLEANPNSADQQKFADYYRAGVNRLSIGVQSFSDPHLRRLGRLHSSAQARLAVNKAREAGFENINLDLMHGLPEQTVAQALADLRQAMALNPEHLSWYQLTIEKNTLFYRQPPLLPVDDELAEIETSGLAALQASGYQRYEVSAFAKFQRQAAHNLNYWQFGDYLGIGPGAHGKITLPNNIKRTQTTRIPEHYLDKTKTISAKTNAKTIVTEELIGEFALNALRTTFGIDKVQFEQRTGISFAQLMPIALPLLETELLRVTNDGYTTTALGLRFLDNVVAAFIEK